MLVYVAKRAEDGTFLPGKLANAPESLTQDMGESKIPEFASWLAVKYREYLEACEKKEKENEQ